MALLDYSVRALVPAWTRREADVAWLVWVLAAHAAGMAVVAWRLERQRRRIAGLRARAFEIRTGRALERLHEAAAALGWRGPLPAALASAEVDSPMAVGIGRRAIVLPAAYDNAVRDSALRAVLAHELQHHRPCDIVVEWVSRAITAFWWFNPVAWALARRIRALAEERCDRAVLDAGVADAEAYCRAILEAASVAQPPALAVGAGTHPLARRFRRVLSAAPPRPLTRFAPTLVVVAFAALALPSSSVRPDPAPGSIGTPGGNGRIVIERVIRGPAMTRPSRR